MAGSGTAQQDTRSDLEDCVLRLGREKSVLQAAVAALTVEQRQAHEYLVCFHSIAYVSRFPTKSSRMAQAHAGWHNLVVPFSAAFFHCRS